MRQQKYRYYFQHEETGYTTCRSCNSKKHNHIYENKELLGDN